MANLSRKMANLSKKKTKQHHYQPYLHANRHQSYALNHSKIQRPLFVIMATSVTLFLPT